ncbi:MAG TPA: hypothetical protein VF623_07780 [Segetibacter sp.]|jgi:hypothetical protein
MNLKLSLFVFLLTASYFASAQENSPFSRYGVGDPVPGQNIVNRSMGGVSSTYAGGLSINFSNPASYSQIGRVTYDIGITLDSRVLKSTSPVLKYNSINLTPSYVALGLPLSVKHKLGMSFGLRPLTSISYSIAESRKYSSANNTSRDSALYLYEGDGGLYQAFVGLGKRWGGLSVGFNTGYMFGRKENATRVLPFDTVATYKSNSSTNTTFGNVFLNAGLQYEVPLNKAKTSFLRFGLAGNLKQSMSARQQSSRETFNYDANGVMITIDTVFQSPEIKGTIKLPASYTAGISLHNIVNNYEKSMIAIEYENTAWSNYRFYDQPDKLTNSWKFKLGGQFIPNLTSIKSYWNRVTYRAGVNIGKDAINADGKALPSFGLSLGAGLPVGKWRSFDYQYTIINAGFEIGKRGNNKNVITENFFRFSLGFNLSDVWFQKRRYD